MRGSTIITGGGFVTASGFGRLSDGHAVTVSPGEPVLPARSEVFDEPPSRFGRFDSYTWLGCAAAALAMRDAGLVSTTRKQSVGIVSSSSAGSLETDLAYYRTTLEQDGLRSSPNLFCYTLPGIVQGECARLFDLTGPTFCLGEDGHRGLCALVAAMRVLEAGEAGAMLAGWIDSPPAEVMNGSSEKSRGALFVVAETSERHGSDARVVLARRGERVVLEDGTELSSLTDLFGTVRDGA